MGPTVTGPRGTPRYRRRVAADLGVTEAELERALSRMEREQEADGYRSLSHNDRMKAFAAIIEIPLTQVAAIDGVSSLLPDPKPMEKRTSRPPTKKASGAVRSNVRKAPRRKKVEVTVPIRKYAWEMDPKERAAHAEAKKNPPPPVDPPPAEEAPPAE